jgi:hypothetical protein
MSIKEEPLPADQYTRVVEELRKFAVIMDEVQGYVETVHGIEAAEARRCFSWAAARLQEAGYWFGQGLKHAQKSGKIPP